VRGGSIAGLALAVLTLAAPAAAAPQQVLYVGDSLGVGTTPGFARELGADARVHGDSRIGRPSPEGLRVLGQTLTAADDIVVFDLGSNDDLAQPALLARDLAGARHVTGDRCLIVATLNRPPFNGVSVDGLNQAILAFASASPNVQLVDWNALAESEPGVLGPDGVHPTPQGYALRAQLFAEAVAACSQAPAGDSDLLASPEPATTPKKRQRKREPHIKVPGIESSGISFTEPVRVAGRDAQLLLPNTKPPYPAIVMLAGSQSQAEFFAAHGIATLRGATDGRAAVSLLAKRDDIGHAGIALWAFGTAADQAALVAATDAQVAAVVAVSPAVLPAADVRAWRARRSSDAPAVGAWLRMRARTDARSTSDPATTWRRVPQPVLAIWGTRDDTMPIRASAGALKRALAAAPNGDRTFRWFDASHAASAPGLLEETARWLGLRLGEKRTKPVVRDALPPANRGTSAASVANASAVYGPPIQALWFLAPLVLLGVAARRTRRMAAIAIATGIGCAACVAGGIVLVLNADGDSVSAWPLVLAFVFAAGLLVCSGFAASRRAWLVTIACDVWLALALFWLV
jgi:hypothetical protein